MTKHGRKRNNITGYTRAYTHSTGFCVFCCHKCHTNAITHYVITVYIDFRNNISHCHTFTLLLHSKNSPKHHPQNNFSTSNPKQPVTFHKTTRCFQQNDTLFSVKRYVVFYKMTRCFQQNDTMFLVKRHVVFGMMKYFQPHPL